MEGAHGRVEKSVESLNMTIALLIMSSSFDFPDVERLTHSRKSTVNELSPSVSQDAPRDSEDADQVFVDCFSNRVWLLVWDRDHYHVTREAINHRYDIFAPRAIVVWSNQVD
jgi:hypothetical protein